MVDTETYIDICFTWSVWRFRNTYNFLSSTARPWTGSGASNERSSFGSVTKYTSCLTAEARLETALEDQRLTLIPLTPDLVFLPWFSAFKNFCSSPRSLTLLLIPVKLFLTSTGSWSDFITWTTFKNTWLIDWLNYRYGPYSCKIKGLAYVRQKSNRLRWLPFVVWTGWAQRTMY